MNEAQEAASSDNIMVQVGDSPLTQGIASSSWEQSKLPVCAAERMKGAEHTMGL